MSESQTAVAAQIRAHGVTATVPSAATVICGHAFIQNLRRGHYELGAEARIRHLYAAALFAELTAVI